MLTERERILRAAARLAGVADVTLRIYDGPPGYPCFVNGEIRYLDTDQRSGGERLRSFDRLGFYANVDAKNWADGVAKQTEAKQRFMQE